MSAKLDQSLEDIVMTDRKANRGRPGIKRGRIAKTKARSAAPAGGISKNSKAVKGPKPATQVPVTAATRDGGKILVSGLPIDVNEATIKDYFQKQIGGVKRVIVAYGPNGKSRGEATIIFTKAQGALKAVQEVNGLTIDGSRKIKVEMIMGASKTAQAEPKSLSERVSQPKAATKAAKKTTGNQTKAATAAAATASSAKNGRARRVKSSRPKPKTAEELDAEMTDYFGNGGDATAGAVNGAAPQPTAGGDAMDEIQ